MKLQERGMGRDIFLTEEEAIGLLDMLMMYPGELTPEQRTSMLKLSEFCRQFLREGVEASPSRGRIPVPSCAPPYAA